MLNLFVCNVLVCCDTLINYVNVISKQSHICSLCMLLLVTGQQVKWWYRWHDDFIVQRTSKTLETYFAPSWSSYKSLLAFHLCLLLSALCTALCGALLYFVGLMCTDVLWTSCKWMTTWVVAMQSDADVEGNNFLWLIIHSYAVCNTSFITQALFNSLPCEWWMVFQPISQITKYCSRL